MNFKDSFLLLLLVGFCSATVHLQITGEDPAVEHRLCYSSEQRRQKCTPWNINRNDCTDVALNISFNDPGGISLKLISEDGEILFDGDKDMAPYLKEYISFINCGADAILIKPLILIRKQYKDVATTYLDVGWSDPVREKDNNKRRDKEEPASSVHVQCLKLSKAGVQLPQDKDINRDFHLKGTPLATAIEIGDTEAVEQLIAKGARLTNIAMGNLSAVHYSIISCKDDLLKLFVDRGVDIKATTSAGLSPLHIAVSRGSLKMLQAILQLYSGNINDLSYMGMSALHMAAFSQPPNTFEILKKYGANITSMSSQGLNALHIAVRSNSPESVRKLIELGADINEEDRFGESPLITAATSRRPAIVELLIELGAKVDPVKVKNLINSGKLDDKSKRLLEMKLTDGGKLNDKSNQLLQSKI